MKPELFDRFLDVYKINFDTNDQLWFQSKELLNHVITSFIALNTFEMVAVTQSFERDKNAYKASYGYFHWLLFECFLSCKKSGY